MKKHLLFSFFLLLFISQASIAQTYIWGGPGDKNSEFNGGLNDWTTSGTPNAALWVWKANGKADKGAYWGTRGAIASPSVANGVAVFDSDFYDNGGTGVSGSGTAPAPHTSYLISPEFSCVGHANLWLQFNQYMRMFASVTSVEYSIDGGTNWVSVQQVNASLSYNQVTGADSKILIPLPAGIDNQATVKIRFVFAPNPDDDRCYYFWIIDDVYILEAPAGDPKIIGTWAPLNHYGIPVDHVQSDSLDFVMDVANFGGKAITGVKAKVTVVNSDLNKTIYTSDEKTFDLDQSDTTRIFFNSQMLPAVSDTGLYTVKYTISADGAATTGGKTFTQYFRVYPNKFTVRQNDCDHYITSYRNTDLDEDSGVSYQGSGANGPIYTAYDINYYKLGDWVENSNLKFRASSATVAATTTETTNTISYDASIALFELADTLDSKLYNFNFADGIGVDGKESTQLTYLGYGTASFTGIPKWYERELVDLYDLNDDAGIDLKPNKKYFVAAIWPSGTRIYHAYDNYNSGGDERYYYFEDGLYQKNSFLYTSNDQRFYLMSKEYGAWTLDLNIEVIRCSTSSNDELLPENTFVINENPTSGILDLGINFEKSIDKATIIITDTKGRMINMRTLYNLNKSDEIFNLINLSSGQYFVTLYTKDKLLTKSFSIIK